MDEMFLRPSTEYLLFSNLEAESSEKEPRTEKTVLYVWSATQVASLLSFLLAAYIIPEHRRTHPSFPKIRPHAPDTMQTPSRRQLSFSGKFKQSLWAIGKRLKERDTKYAFKAGMATAMLAAPAFFDATRPTFVAYWGDWALISARFLPFFSKFCLDLYPMPLVFYCDLSYHWCRKYTSCVEFYVLIFMFYKKDQLSQSPACVWDAVSVLASFILQSTNLIQVSGPRLPQVYIASFLKILTPSRSLGSVSPCPAFIMLSPNHSIFPLLGLFCWPTTWRVSTGESDAAP